MKHTTIDLEQQENEERGRSSESPVNHSKSLVVVPALRSITTASPMTPVAISDRSAWTQPAPHAECQCARCRRKRTRRRGSRKEKKRTATPYIEAEYITVTEWTDREGASAPPLSQATSTRDLRVSPRTRRVARWHVSLLSAALLAFVFLLVSGNSLQAYLLPSAAVTIIPSSTRESLTIDVPGVVGHTGANQVAARFLRGTSPTRTVVARASGSGKTPAKAARGTLVFYNQGPSPQTIRAGVSLTGADGIAVVTDDAVTVPAGNPPTLGTAEVGAHSVQTTSQANIAAGDISELCCVAGISVKNTAFSGGRDAQTYPVLVQHDLDLASTPVVLALTQQAQDQIHGQVSGREQLALGPQCHTTIADAPAAGSHVAQATLSVSAVCNGEAFDRDGALGLAASLFTQKAAKQLGPYRLVSRVTTRITRFSLSDVKRGLLSISVQAQGTWCYQWSQAAQLSIARHIAGKSDQTALSILAKAPGVAHTSISLSGGAQHIPTDPARITIDIMQVGEPAS